MTHLAAARRAHCTDDVDQAFPPGWWLFPAIIGGAICWPLLIWAVL